MRWNDFDFFGFDLLHFIDRMLDSIHSKVPPAANFICRPARCYRGHDGPSDRNATISALMLWTAPHTWLAVPRILGL